MLITKKNMLVLGEGPTQGLRDTTVASEPKYPINFTQSGKELALLLHYNGINSFLFVNTIKVYQFKAQDSEVKPYPLCLGNISKDFTIDNMKKTGLKGYAFFVDYNIIDTNDILDIHNYLMKII